MEQITNIFAAVVEGDAATLQSAVKSALESGLPAEQILKDGMIAAMAEVGRRFETGKYFVPEMLISARAMKLGLQVLRPQLAAAEVQPIGKIVIGTAQGDLHDVGKNLVGMMLEGVGFKVIDLGTDVSPQTFVAAVKQHQPQLVGCSALITTTMPRMKDLVEALKAAGLRERVKVIVGGAPVTEEYAHLIGADLYAPDASSAATRAKQAVLQTV